MRVDLFVDPACMWTWLTSRWLVEVAPQRGLQVRWRSYSLLLRDGPAGLEDWKAALWGASHRAVRVMQALHADDPDAVRGLLRGVTQGLAAYNAGGPPFQDLHGALAVAGLAPTYAATADDAAWDEPVRRSMAEAFAVVGQRVGIPALVVHLDPPVGLLGPLVSPPPTGTDAVRLWDAAVAFATVPGALELSRPRPRRPTVPGLQLQPGRTSDNVLAGVAGCRPRSSLAGWLHPRIAFPGATGAQIGCAARESNPEPGD